jgi:hypothetical protein
VTRQAEAHLCGEGDSRRFLPFGKSLFNPMGILSGRLQNLLYQFSPIGPFNQFFELDIWFERKH